MEDINPQVSGGILSEIETDLDIEFSDLDFFLLPEVTPDLLIAERLDHMLHFTSSMGMAAFADCESFERRQKLISDAHGKRALRINEIKEIQNRIFSQIHCKQSQKNLSKAFK